MIDQPILKGCYHDLKENHKIPTKDIPDMVAKYFVECCGTCQNGLPISTTSDMVLCSCDNKQKNENRVCRNLYVRASLW